MSDYPDYMMGISIQECVIPIEIFGDVVVSGVVSIVGTVTVNVEGSVTVQGTVSISGLVTVTGAVTVAGTVSISGTVNVSGTVSISGSVTVTGAVTISGAVTITSGTINIQTATGLNIIIDKLKQDAFLERQVDIRNDNGVTSPNNPPEWITGESWYGKFFPRGCRGNLRDIYIYCKRTMSGTLTLGYAPFMGMGALGTITITPSIWWDWKRAGIRAMWNYDSLFIWVISCSADVSYGQDAVEPTDRYVSGDSGVTWDRDARRVFIWVSMAGHTVGDINVAGIVNTVEIPNQSSAENYSALIECPNGQETTLLTVNGVGFLDWFHWKASDHHVELKVYCDGRVAFWDDPWSLNEKGVGATTPAVQLTQYQVDGICRIQSDLRFQFERQLKFSALNNTGALQAAQVMNTLIQFLR